MNSTITTPSSPASLYLSCRDLGLSHEQASRQVEHSFGKRDRGPQLIRFREQYEQERSAGELPAESPGHTVEPSPFDQREAELHATIADLGEARRQLALDAFSGDVKARAQLVDVETALADAQAELERIGLARAEAAHREQVNRERVEGERRQAAMARAEQLTGERAKAETKVNTTAVKFADAVAAVYDIAAQQTAALAEAGRDDAWALTVPSQLSLQTTMFRALADRGAPTDWIGQPILG